MPCSRLPQLVRTLAYPSTRCVACHRRLRRLDQASQGNFPLSTPERLVVLRAGVCRPLPRRRSPERVLRSAACADHRRTSRPVVRNLAHPASRARFREWSRHTTSWRPPPTLRRTPAGGRPRPGPSAGGSDIGNMARPSNPLAQARCVNGHSASRDGTAMHGVRSPPPQIADHVGSGDGRPVHRSSVETPQ